jgi:SAM-dependent methyltransferase
MKPLEDYFRLMVANGAVHIYCAAWKHGIIDALTREPMTLHRLAQATNLNKPALHLLIDGLESLGMVERSGDLLHLGAVMQALRGSYRALGDEYWAHLDQWLTTGTPMRRMDKTNESEAVYSEQAAALAWMMSPAAAAVAARLAPTLLPGAAILDIGSGSGVWSLAFLSALPEATATLMDRGGVLTAASDFLARASFASRVRLLPGDYHEVAPPPASHDLAILANVCHLETDAGNRRLIEQTARWLKPGGRIVIIDITPAQQPLAATLYAIGLALRTESAAVPTTDQIAGWLSDAGFLAPHFCAIDTPPGTMGLWTATRPEV